MNKGVNLGLYDYVNNYFKRKFPESYILIPELLVKFKIDNNKLIKDDFLNEFRKNIQNKYSVDDIKSGKVDSQIDIVLNSFVDKYFTPTMRKDCSVLYDYVRDILVKKGIGEKFSNDIFDHFVKSIVASIWTQYDSSRLNTDVFDHIIGLNFESMYRNYVSMINDRVEQLINYNFDILSFRDKRVNMDELKLFVSRMIIKRESREFLSRIDKLKINPNGELSMTGIKLDDYVKLYFKHLNKPKDNIKIQNQNVDNKTKNISVHNEKLLSNDKKNVSQNNGVKRSEILENIRLNSVIGEAVPAKVKVDKKAKQVERKVIALCLLAIVTLNTISMNNYIDRKVEERNDSYAIAKVDSLDGFDYYKKLRNLDYYDKMTDNIIDVYSRYGQVEDENYKTICIYDAYKGSTSLKEMDQIFGILRNKIVENDVQLNLRNVIKADSQQTYFYLDFIYDRLNSMGYNEVNSQEYQDALLRWKYANYGNYYGVVGVSMSNRENAIINDVLSKYEEYCEKNKLSFGYKIGTEYVDFTSNYDDTSVRGHSL